MKQKAVASPGNKLVNWYNKIPPHLKTTYRNPSKAKHGMDVPFRMLVIGTTGSGKTNLVLEVLSRFKDTFGKVLVCCANRNEPLYKYLASKLKEGEEVAFYEGYEQIPNVDSLDNDHIEQHLIIFDDLVLETNPRLVRIIEEYFIRGRKKGLSVMYLTQSYFRTPKVIRLNSNYILLKKLGCTRDLVWVLKDYSLGVDREALLALYKEATAERGDFLLIDVQTADENQRFRKNFLQLI